MKLLVCTANRDIRGGIEAYLQPLMTALSRAGHRIALLYERMLDGSSLIDDGFDLEGVWKLAEGSEGAVWDAVAGWRPDVVFGHGLRNVDFEDRLTTFPVVYYAHNYVGTCLSGFKRHAFPTPAPCRRELGWGCLLHYYPHRCGGLDPFVMWKDYRLQHRTLASLRKSTYLLVASRWMREEYLRHGFPEDTTRQVPLFPTRFRPDGDPPAPRPLTGTVLFAGRLTLDKGGEYLMRALHRVRASGLLGLPFKLDVAGDGPERAALAALARELNVPAVFHGWVPQQQLQQLMLRADVQAVPSLWPEPFGLLGIEGGCVGLPAVGYAHGGITDWLLEGETGELAPSPPTAEGLAEALARALRDPEHYQRLRVGAWRTARSYSLENHLARLDDVFQAARTQVTKATTLVCK